MRHTNLGLQSDITIFVRSTEIDVNGHVNNAKYLEYLEWGREDWYEKCGLDYTTLKDMNVVTVVVRACANYRTEAVQNDQLRIQTQLESVRNTSLLMSQTIHNQHGQKVLDAEFTIVTVDPISHQKVRVPDDIRQFLQP